MKDEKPVLWGHPSGSAASASVAPLVLAVMGCVFLMLAVVGCGVFTDDSPTTSAAVALSTTTVTRPATTTTQATTTTTEPVTLYKWEATGEVDGLGITVSEPVWDKRQYVMNAQGTRMDDYKVLTTKVVLENITDKPHIYSAAYFMLADTEGGSYLGNDEDDVSYSKHKAMRSGYLDPGNKITRWVTFIVPIGAAGESISYSKDGSFGGHIQALWQS